MVRQLIKLEIEKFQLRKQIIGIVLTIIGILVFLTISFLDSYTDPAQSLDTSENVSWMINLLNTGAFLVYSSTLVSKIIINEYSKGTIFVLFSYPINRMKLILSKVIIIVLFTVFSILFGETICTLYANLLNANIDVMTSMITWDYNLVFLFISGSLLGGILSVLPFVTGMFTRSTSVPIVTSIILVAIMQLLIGRNPEIITTVINLCGVALVTILLTYVTLTRKIGP